MVPWLGTPSVQMRPREARCWPTISSAMISGPRLAGVMRESRWGIGGYQGRDLTFLWRHGIVPASEWAAAMVPRAVYQRPHTRTWAQPTVLVSFLMALILEWGRNGSQAGRE